MVSDANSMPLADPPGLRSNCRARLLSMVKSKRYCGALGGTGFKDPHGRRLGQR